MNDMNSGRIPLSTDETEDFANKVMKNLKKDFEKLRSMKRVKIFS